MHTAYGFVAATFVSIADYHAMEKAVEARGFKHNLSPEAPSQARLPELIRRMRAIGNMSQ